MKPILYPAILALEDGSIFRGKSLQANGLALGEVVFNTAMTGYQEILTDPSYAGQMITFTYPHIGNVGINENDMESKRIHARGAIVRSLSYIASNWRSEKSLIEFISGQGCLLITEVDTRALTQKIRSQGALKGCIVTAKTENEINTKNALHLCQTFNDLETKNLSDLVSTNKPYEWNEQTLNFNNNNSKNFDELNKFDEDNLQSSTFTSMHIVVLDFGVKASILRSLRDLGCSVTVLPGETSVQDIISLKPQGIVLSNGPGDPMLCHKAIEHIKILLTYNLPILGICLGHQLLALSLGAKTVKMKFGHHGANHPVQSLETGQVFITSQNHGFRVEDNSLSSEIKITHRSLFDGTLQGMRHRTKPIFGFQGHPEASPGPHDVKIIFYDFLKVIEHLKSKTEYKDALYA